MNPTKITVCGLCILSLVNFINAKDSYYYYNGAPISLELSDDSVTVYGEIRKNGLSDQPLYFSEDLSSREVSATKKEYTSIEYCVKEINGLLVKMSNRFYVQLYDSIRDVQELERLAKETHTVILGRVPYMPDWYELAVHNSIISNSLEMSNYFYETGLFKNVDPGFVFNFTPSCVSDSNYPIQWGLPKVNACNAWNITKGSTNVKIAIIDGNILTSHTEFSTTLFVNQYNTTTNSTLPSSSYNYHGTRVCGIIAADHNHAKMAGVAPNCKIMPISYSDANTNMVSAQLASGISWAVSHNADVINCSWGDHHGQYLYLHSSILEYAIQNALKNGRGGKGCVIVFAAGNQSTAMLDYPAYIFSDIITVGATNSSNKRASFSSYGNALDVVAPGNDIYSTTHEGGYDNDRGTSYATPLVSGIAGLILSVNPYLTQKDVSTIIESTAQKVSSETYNYATTSGRPNGTWNEQMGYGLVNAYAAVYKAKYKYIIGPEFVCNTDKFYVTNLNLQSGTTISWTLSNPTGSTPPYSIVGPTNTDTITIAYNSNVTNPNGSYQTLTATIVRSGTTYTAQKKLFFPSLATPQLSISNTTTTWNSGTSRTFSITNNTGISDAAFHWTIKKTTTYTNPLHVETTNTNHVGRSLVYNATTPQNSHSILEITITNTQKECDPKSITLTYLIVRATNLSATNEGGTLRIAIEEGESVSHQQLLSIKEKQECTLELWHSIYGRLQTTEVHNVSEQIDVRGLPQGVYVLLLKENNEVIARTKVQIW